MVRNQKGFSLVELIVVIAIMAVLSTVGVLSFAVVSGRYVSSCAEELISYIGDTRMEALSRASAELEIFVKNDGVYVHPSVEARDIKIGKAGIEVSYTAGGANVTLSETERLVLSFDRSSGAFTPLNGGANYCDEIRIVSGRHSARIVVVPQTGKFYMEE